MTKYRGDMRATEYNYGEPIIRKTGATYKNLQALKEDVEGMIALDESWGLEEVERRENYIRMRTAHEDLVIEYFIRAVTNEEAEKLDQADRIYYEHLERDLEGDEAEEVMGAVQEFFTYLDSLEATKEEDR